MTETFGKRYLAELEQLLQAEAELRRQGTELLDDPEYRALRERFIEGEITLAQLSERVDTLAMTRGEDDIDMSEWRRPGEGDGGESDGGEGEDPEGDPDDEDIDDLEVLDDVIEVDDAAAANDAVSGTGEGSNGAGSEGGAGSGGGGGDGGGD